MAALAMSTPWLPQDDLLLKNSIEAGASLESLARGAVEFSRKFSVKELQDRWLLLLYDPVVSSQACARMAELELTVAPLKSKKVDIPKESNLGNDKRKAESVRNCYYARKRICKETLDQGDLSFLMDNTFIDEAGVLENPLESNFGVEDGNFDGLYDVCTSDLGYGFFVGQQNTLEDAMDQNISMNEQMPNMLEDSNGIGEMCRSEELSGHNIFEATNIETKPACNSSDCGTSYEHLSYSPSLPEMATWKSVENMLLSELPDDVGSTGVNLSTVDQFGVNDDAAAAEGTSDDGAVHLSSVLTNPMSFIDLKNSTDITDGYFADISDIKFTNEDAMQIIDEGDDEIDDTSFDGLNNLLLNTLDYVVDDEVCSMPGINELPAIVPAIMSDVAETHIRESNVQSCSVNQSSTSTATFDPRFPEYHNGVICCVLNTEDPEIPCNDDIIFPSKRPASGNRRTQNKATVPPSCGKDKTGTQASEKYLSTTNMESKLVVNGLTETRQCESRYGGLCQISTGVNKEYPDFRSCDVEKSGQIAESNQVEMNVGGMIQEAQQIPSLLNFGAPSFEEDNKELVSSEHEQFSDSDADIPSFSDVESMILGMDLGPADQDILCAAKVAKYQQEDAMKAIIRLEQNAHSCMRRQMASHGAFALLFGRHSKHYIKKPQVLLGRATDGVNVDIDLTREGRANKISRRQALIKMSREGTFSLKNLGRCTIYVNSEEISPGQCLELHSDCLIEIRGIPLIFVANQPQVRLYLDKAVQ